MKKKYIVNGMSCSACSSAVERVVKKISGVKNATVNLTMKLLVVEGENFSDENILSAIKKAGFSGKIYAEDKSPSFKKMLFGRLLPSILLLLILTYVNMAEMLNLPYFYFLSKTNYPIVFLSTQIVLCLVIMIINKKFFINGTKAVINRSMNMDTLVAFGSLTSFLYGVYIFIRVILSTNQIEIASLIKNLYFESSAMILTLVSIGKTIEEFSKQKTQNAVLKLKKLAPKTAFLLVDGTLIETDVDLIKVGDVVAIKKGQSIPCDCVIEKGECEVDESSLTGESLPVFKQQGQILKTATILVEGYVEGKVIAVKEDTVFSKIVDSVITASSSKIKVQKLVDKISGIFVPIVISIALITFLAWFLITFNFNFALNFAISVLVISCPCSLGLATPVAITVATGKCAQSGILLKNAEVLETVGLVKSVFLDKTGTITTGNIVVDEVFSLTDEDKDCVLALEKMSNHLIANAISKNFENGSEKEVENYRYITGSGVLGTVNGNEYYIGKNCKNDENSTLYEKSLELKNQGKTVVYCLKNGELIGLISLVDEIKDSSVIAVNKLNEMGINSIILSGDSKEVCEIVKEKLNATAFYGERLPEEKSEVIKNYANEGKTMFVGDGVNDSVAIKSADVGVSLLSGTDIAISFSDMVFLKNDLTQIIKSIKIGKKCRRIIKQNLFWAFFYNFLAIPIACGLLYFPFNLMLNPIISSACMSLSSIFVVLNALRLFK